MSAQLYALAALALGLESGAIGRRSYCWPMLVVDGHDCYRVRD